MKKTVIILAALFLTLSSSGSLMAFTRGACKSDAAKFCPDIPYDLHEKTEIKECLKKHVAQLSDGCKTNILEAAVKKESKKQE